MSRLLSPQRAWLGVTAQSTAGCHRQQHGRASASSTGLEVFHSEAPHRFPTTAFHADQLVYRKQTLLMEAASPFRCHTKLREVKSDSILLITT